jgi:titin
VTGGAINTRIGGEAETDRNVISGNGTVASYMGYGVVVQQTGTTGTKILGNYIGTKADGIGKLANNFDGIYLALGSSNTTIGGAAAGARNIISGNGYDPPMGEAGVKRGVGIYIHAASTGNHVENNYVGKKADGTNLANVDGWWTADETLNTFLNNEHNN